jgi:formylglycine-generating enzyme required for sulfatase activity
MSDVPLCSIAVAEQLAAAEMKMVIGDVQRDAEKFEEALASYQEALGIYQFLSNRSGIAKAEGRIRQLQGLGGKIETSEPFEVVTVDRMGVVIDRQQHSVHYFREVLPGDIELDMISIPSGEFLMGSPEGEGSENQKPQHFVTVPAFFMGKYPVTQEQWRSIALQKELQVTRKLSSEPSRFSGYNKPVMDISWHDAVEFCARLSKLTNGNYCRSASRHWHYPVDRANGYGFRIVCEAARTV